MGGIAGWRGVLRRFSSILLWSVIAAAFIGPGTVTTAAAAGASFGTALLWALLFSTLACFVLQEASARLTVVTGRTLGQALRDRYRDAVSGVMILLLVLGAIVLGCAAYEAGNILGGVAGAALATGWSKQGLTLLCGLAAFLLLWSQAPRRVARLLSIAVAVMGIAFLATAWRLAPGIDGIASGLLVPRLPGGEAGVLVLGLVGTTVVPYNLFLGSGLARGERLDDLRLGLAVAIGLGGAVSMGVLVVGTAVAGVFAYEALAEVLETTLGGWAGALFGLGLFAAGFSSAITAPLAAAMTAADLFDHRGDGGGQWHRRSWRYRGIWIGVLLTGLIFGLTDVRPIPAIILAQALNGLLLPLVAIFLLIAVNDRRSMGSAANRWVGNLSMSAVVWVSLLLGVGGIWRATVGVIGGPAPRPAMLVVVTMAIALALIVPIHRVIRRSRA